MGGPGYEQAVEQQDECPAGGLERRLVETVADGARQGQFSCLDTHRVDLAGHLRLVAHSPEEQFGLRPGQFWIG
ncbi:hypothetical protein D3C80_2158470 [compost metagenome]